MSIGVKIMNDCVEVRVAEDILFLKTNNVTYNSRTKQFVFENSYTGYETLLNCIKENWIVSEINIHIIASKKINCCYHLELFKFLTMAGIKVEITMLTNTPIGEGHTEKLDFNALKRRLTSIESIIVREENRVVEMINDKKSKIITSMILQSIENYKMKQSKLKNLLAYIN